MIMLSEPNTEFSKRDMCSWYHITSSKISWLVHPKHPRQREKLYFIALAVAESSPTKQQTEGAYKVMHLMHNLYCIVPVWKSLRSSTDGTVFFTRT